MKRFIPFFTIFLIFGYTIAVHTGIITHDIISIRLYPCVMNLIMFSIFFYSILRPPTIIEKLASLKVPHLPPRVIKYTKNLRRLSRYVLNSKKIPVSDKKLFLVKGFKWEAIHTQRLLDCKQRGAEKYFKP